MVSVAILLVVACGAIGYLLLPGALAGTGTDPWATYAPTPTDKPVYQLTSEIVESAAKRLKTPGVLPDEVEAIGKVLHELSVCLNAPHKKVDTQDPTKSNPQHAYPLLVATCQKAAVADNAPKWLELLSADYLMHGHD